MLFRHLRNILNLCCVLTVLFFIGLMFVFLHSYYLCSYRTVRNFHDPRWRVFDFNSRQASEDEIYNTTELPVLKDVHLIDERRLRFEFFTPFRAESWTTLTEPDWRIIAEGNYPEIPFPDHESMETYILKPKGVSNAVDITIQIGFWPKENYRKEGCSWPDNYWIETISVPVSLKQPRTVDEWAGIPDTDPEIIEARHILGNTVDINAPTIEKIEQVYRFMMENTNFAHEIPSDEMQAASPLETYRLMNSGEGKGFCENHALVYYLFANTVGVRTRLVDLGGKLGPLKLTGHFFCESWVPEYGTWAYVDPETYIAYVTNAEGVPQTTLNVKRLVDLNVFEGYSARVFDFESGVYIEKSDDEMRKHFSEYWILTILQGDVVLGYTFGYGNNMSFSKIRNFLFGTTLLYAPFALPKHYLVKYIFMYGFIASFVVTVLIGFAAVLMRRKRGK